MDTPQSDATMHFRYDREAVDARRVLLHVYRALREKGYDPTSQLVGYLLSGDPTFITNHAGARALVRSVDRDVLLEELVRGYMEAELRGAAGA